MQNFFRYFTRERSPSKLDENEPKTLDNYHTHFLLLDDDNSTPHFLPDTPRSDFVDAMHRKTPCFAITIIVEGGFGSLEVILNDLRAKPKRPVIIIQGSGCLADILSTLLENHQNVPE